VDFKQSRGVNRDRHHDPPTFQVSSQDFFSSNTSHTATNITIPSTDTPRLRGIPKPRCSVGVSQHAMRDNSPPKISASAIPVRQPSAFFCWSCTFHPFRFCARGSHFDTPGVRSRRHGPRNARNGRPCRELTLPCANVTFWKSSGVPFFSPSLCELAFLAQQRAFLRASLEESPVEDRRRGLSFHGQPPYRSLPVSTPTIRYIRHSSSPLILHLPSCIRYLKLRDPPSRLVRVPVSLR
jgi:hypothetical protein